LKTPPCDVSAEGDAFDTARRHGRVGGGTDVEKHVRIRIRLRRACRLRASRASASLAVARLHRLRAEAGRPALRPSLPPYPAYLPYLTYLPYPTYLP